MRTALVFLTRLCAVLLCVSLGADWGFCAPARAGEKILGPFVAGVFYPQDKEALAAAVQGYLDKAAPPPVAGTVRGIVAPHAGYQYSGPVAASAYKTIPPDTRQVILMAPSHRVAFAGVSIPAAEALRTPLGDVPVAWEALLLSKASGFTSVPEAHQGEHSLEVQLPFLQQRLGRFDVIPLLFGQCDPLAVANALLPYLKEGVLLVASSDLSHYYTYDTAVQKDSICTSAMASLDFNKMTACEGCGTLPVQTLMHIASFKGWQGALLDARNSGDTSGDKSRVVGYAAVAFSETGETSKGESPMAGTWSDAEKQALLKLARSVITAQLVRGEKVVRPEKPTPAMLENRGCFVTLRGKGRLRGCIGTMEPAQPLIEGIEANAANAAFRDPRFPPLAREELSEIDIEISVLTVPKKITFTDGKDLLSQLVPGKHGVILSRGMRRSTFLPQVWDELPNKENFLIHLCRKGGMTPNCWQDTGTTVEVYEAEVFGE
jgi:AmmeMemoRadiSam system protein B/AmmeMemoRadiSam system protein A